MAFFILDQTLHKAGAFKFKTECAPNNGYFLVAVYDKVK